MWKIPAFWALVFLSGASWGAWSLVIHKISPHESADIAFIAFYSTFFLLLTFSFALITALIWKIFLPTHSSYICIKNGIREGFFLAIAGISALGLYHAAGSISWKEIILLMLLVLLVEGFFLENK